MMLSLSKPCCRSLSRNGATDEAGMPRRNFGTLNVLFLELHAKRVDSCESPHGVLEAMIDHPNHRHFVLENASHRFESRFALVSRTTAIEVASELPIQFVVPEIRDAYPRCVIAGSGVGQSENVLSRVEDNFDALVSVHRARERDDTLLTVDEPIHQSGPKGTRIAAPSSRLLEALPEQKGRDRETAIERVDEMRRSTLLPDVLALKLGNNDATVSVVLDELPDLDGLMFEMCFGHVGLFSRDANEQVSASANSDSPSLSPEEARKTAMRRRITLDQETCVFAIPSGSASNRILPSGVMGSKGEVGSADCSFLPRQSH